MAMMSRAAAAAIGRRRRWGPALAPAAAARAVASWFGHVEPAAKDPILGVTEAFLADPSPDKVNVGVGAYRDDDGRPVVLECVREAERRIAGSMNMEYLPMGGSVKMIDESLKLAYGEDSQFIKDRRIAAVQALSGTGACRLFADFQKRFLPDTQIYIPTPTWANHHNIWRDAHVPQMTFTYYHPESRGLDFSGLMGDIKNAPDGSFFLLHACAHNPTGVDPSEEQWREKSHQFKVKKHFPFFDMAYQGFASGDPERDAKAIRIFLEDGHQIGCAQSYAKNMGLYGQRAGCLSILCDDEMQAVAVKSQLQQLARPMYSNPPLHGALIVSTILSDPELKTLWLKEVKGMADRIIGMRKSLKENLERLGSPLSWEHITNQMNRAWMNGDRRSRQFIDGLHEFLNAAETHKPSSGFICCPCKDCKNGKEYSSSKTVHAHLLRKGFMSNYVCWTKHGEKGVIQEDDEVDDDRIPDFAQYGIFGDTMMGDDEQDGGRGDPIQDEPIHDDPIDELEQMLRDEKKHFHDKDREFLKFQQMLEDHKALLYPDCKEGHKKLRSTLELLQWKAANGVSDKGFQELLKLIKKLLPEGNVLPSTTYEAKRVVCPLGLEVEKIHACPNDCMLYRGKEYEDLEACPVCQASRFKIRRDDPGDDDVEGGRARKRVPAKVMWYFPIIPRLKRLFRNKEHAKMMRWHKEERKEDGMLRHPADGSQWRKIDRTYKHFADDARNIRFGLSTDGMNPFSDMSSSHSIWPVTICMFNLPPWLCLKRKFIMMPALIQGPKQPGNDIDVYLKPLVEDLLKLWDDGVPMWDAHKQEEFVLRALLFVTIND